jgi:hypothetical protein
LAVFFAAAMFIALLNHRQDAGAPREHMERDRANYSVVTDSAMKVEPGIIGSMLTICPSI